METARQKIVYLSKLLIEICRDGTHTSVGGFRDNNIATSLSPAAVLALDGDEWAKDFFLKKLSGHAAEGWGLSRFSCGSGLNDAFSLRSAIGAYRGLLDEGLIPREHLREVAPWFYQHARIRSSGAVVAMPGFEAWHQRNQNVPASLVYLVASLLKDYPEAGSFDLEPLLKWADSMMVGWDVTWRTPDDSWLYQYIWIWSAYIHARHRRPELLATANARRSFEFYRTLSLPGGHTIVFGDANPDERLGPCLACALGASLYQDAELLYISEELLNRAVETGKHHYLLHRAPELFSLYYHWPDKLKSREPRNRHTVYLTSPLPGEGWSLDGTPYEDLVKTTDERFPNRGINTCNYDDLYQVQDLARYGEERPDKLIFTSKYGPGDLVALVDFRAQGLHDHPDALGVTTLFWDGITWLVESVYEPRGYNRSRWLHNVPLFLPRLTDGEGLKGHQTDTWKEPGLVDVRLIKFQDAEVAVSRLRAGSFDYVNFDEELADIERYFLYVPGKLFAVLDRFVVHKPVEVTVGQIWHTPGRVERTTSGFRFRKKEREICMGLASSGGSEISWQDREIPNPPKEDRFYFDGSVQDILNWTPLRVTGTGGRFAFAACFSREPKALTVRQNEAITEMDCAGFRLSIGRFGEVVLQVR